MTGISDLLFTGYIAHRSVVGKKSTCFMNVAPLIRERYFIAWLFLLFSMVLGKLVNLENMFCFTCYSMDSRVIIQMKIK